MCYLISKSIKIYHKIRLLDKSSTDLTRIILKMKKDAKNIMKIVEKAFNI